MNYLPVALTSQIVFGTTPDSVKILRKVNDELLPLYSRMSQFSTFFFSTSKHHCSESHVFVFLLIIAFFPPQRTHMKTMPFDLCPFGALHAGDNDLLRIFSGFFVLISCLVLGFPPPVSPQNSVAVRKLENLRLR